MLVAGTCYVVWPSYSSFFFCFSTHKQGPPPESLPFLFADKIWAHFRSEISIWPIILTPGSCVRSNPIINHCSTEFLYRIMLLFSEFLYSFSETTRGGKKLKGKRILVFAQCLCFFFLFSSLRKKNQ